MRICPDSGPKRRCAQRRATDHSGGDHDPLTLPTEAARLLLARNGSISAVPLKPEIRLLLRPGVIDREMLGAGEKRLLFRRGVCDLVDGRLTPPQISQASSYLRCSGLGL